MTSLNKDKYVNHSSREIMTGLKKLIIKKEIRCKQLYFVTFKTGAITSIKVFIYLLVVVLVFTARVHNIGIQYIIFTLIQILTTLINDLKRNALIFQFTLFSFMGVT